MKQSFEEVADEIAKQSFDSVADIGCAAGAFPAYLKKRFPKAEVYGFEYVDQLLKKARSDFPLVKLSYCNVLDSDSITNQFDVVTLLGVLGIFDDQATAIRNVLNWVKPNGRLILHTMMSEYDIDVFVKYKKSSESYPEDLEKGWNIISEKSLSTFVEINGAQIIAKRDFKLRVELKKQRDVMRSWTEKNSVDGNDIFNALHIRQPQKIVVIKKH